MGYTIGRWVAGHRMAEHIYHDSIMVDIENGVQVIDVEGFDPSDTHELVVDGIMPPNYTGEDFNATLLYVLPPSENDPPFIIYYRMFTVPAGNPLIGSINYWRGVGGGGWSVQISDYATIPHTRDWTIKSHTHTITRIETQPFSPVLPRTGGVAASEPFRMRIGLFHTGVLVAPRYIVGFALWVP